MGFSIIKHPFWGTPYFRKPPYWDATGMARREFRHVKIMSKSRLWKTMCWTAPPKKLSGIPIPSYSADLSLHEIKTSSWGYPIFKRTPSLSASGFCNMTPREKAMKSHVHHYTPHRIPIKSINPPYLPMANHHDSSLHHTVKYALVNLQIAIENGHRQFVDLPTEQWGCSIVMSQFTRG